VAAATYLAGLRDLRRRDAAHGLGLGAALARGIGQVADYVAGAAVIVVGAWMLLAGGKDEDEKASLSRSKIRFGR
jgi:putative Mn2+ efflux pump MntP